MLQKAMFYFSTRYFEGNFTFLAIGLILLSAPSIAQQNTNLLTLLTEPGHVALLRHALAPGTGDPDNFSLHDCDTQRNLNDTGRKQSERIGQIFRDQGLKDLQIYSSEWCRCLETAELIALGDVLPLPKLNSFFQHRARADTQTTALIEWIVQQRGNEPLLLVTHQVNITALSNYYPASGEIVIIEITADEQVIVAGAIKTDEQP